jgi:hypothetical protein
VREVETDLKDKEPEGEYPKALYFSLVAPLKPAIKAGWHAINTVRQD